jgi:hypothetical protein
MLHPSLMKLVENDSFSGKSHENPYFHVKDFEQLCSTQGKTGEIHDVLRRNLFPFSLSGGARTWYHCYGYDHLNWGALRAAFCTRFFPLRRIIYLRMTVLSFQQREKESLGIAWHRFSSMAVSCPVLDLLDLVLLQHFRLGLLKDSGMMLYAI